MLVDLIVVLALVGALAVGAIRGFAESLGLLVGAVIGALAAFWLLPVLTPVAADLMPATGWRTAALAGAAVLVIVIGISLGSAIGSAVRRGVDRTPLRVIDRLVGAALGLVAGALALLLVSTSVTATGIPGVSTALAGSRALQAIDDLTPEPVDAALAQLRGFVMEEGLPAFSEALGAGLGVEVAPTSPAIGLDDPELSAAAASVARVSGTAFACGTSLTGSGFVAADGLVVTNAHVVAGVETPVIELPGGRAGEGRVVYFDPIDDLAVIAVPGLAARALSIVDPVSSGTAVAVQGYPLGGPFTSTGAHVLSVGTVPVPDIYDASSTPRDIYSLQAVVQPGNSGGPLLTGDGAVAGVVFARSIDDAQRGYAMTTTELRPALAAASADGPTVSTGRCTG